MSFYDLSISEHIEYAEYSASVAQQEFEQRRWFAECIWCDRNECDTQKQLEAKGWLLNRHGEFCPSHNYELHGQPRSKHDFIFEQMRREESGAELAH